MQKADPKEIGIPNINFSIDLDNKKDKRNEEYKNQRLERGFDNSELWNLDITIAKFVIPRLKAFKKIITDNNEPFIIGGDYTFYEVLDKIINAFEIIVDDNRPDHLHNHDNEKVTEGLLLFVKYYSHLWY